MLGILINRLIHFYILTNEVERDATMVASEKIPVFFMENTPYFRLDGNIPCFNLEIFHQARCYQKTTVKLPISQVFKNIQG